MKNLLFLALLIPLSLNVFAQYSDSLQRHIILEKVEIEGSRKLRKIVLSTFEKKLHISLDGMHDKFGTKVTAKRLSVEAINAAVFHNDSKKKLQLIQIEGKIKTFDSTAVMIYVAIIQNNEILKTVLLNPSNIHKDQFSLEISDVYVQVGEFLVSYFIKFNEPYEVWQFVNPKKEGRTILVKQQNNSFFIKNASSGLGSIPCPQFKVTCEIM